MGRDCADQAHRLVLGGICQKPVLSSWRVLPMARRMQAPIDVLLLPEPVV